MKLSILITTLLLSATAVAQPDLVNRARSITEKEYPSLEILYRHLHEHPELSLKEEQTSARMAAELRALGFSVTEKIGGYGLAGVLKNGDGPVVLIRTDMDALPIEEKTGLPFASKVRSVNAAGADVGVMHACGHDIHMTVFIGTARVLVQTRSAWKGTLVMIAQPAEEVGFGAGYMFRDKLYEKIPYPDVAIALHNHATLPAGSVGYHAGNFMASVDMMNITVHGKGGHGAAPHLTIDPVVLSAQMIMAFQTIVSREVNPLEPAVITVGSIHGGTVHNIIPDEVKLQLTLRSYSPEVRQQIIASIENKSRQLALQAGLTQDQFPEITINDPKTPATINDRALTEKLVTVFTGIFGEAHVKEMPPSMVGEDFSRFGMEARKIPICMFWLGAADPEKVKAATAANPLPPLHSAMFAPMAEPAIKTGVAAMSAAAFTLFRDSKK